MQQRWRCSQPMPSCMSEGTVVITKACEQLFRIRSLLYCCNSQVLPPGKCHVTLAAHKPHLHQLFSSMASAVSLRSALRSLLLCCTELRCSASAPCLPCRDVS